MSKIVLFSPVGATDPIKFHRDGPMLHIVRIYKPDVIYLFFTKEMANLENQDFRYTQSMKSLNYQPIIEIIQSDINDPSDFDIFIEEYPKIYLKIKEKYPNHQILANVSSGTTQMISSLCLAITSGTFDAIPIQVKTPQNGSNIRRDSLNIDDEIQNLQEDLNNPISRCHEPKITYFRKSLLDKQIISLIKKYNYQGAIQIYDDTIYSNTNLLKILKHALSRISLDLENAKTFDIQFAKDILNLNDGQTDVRQCIEFYYVMKAKQLNGELIDFILRLSPLLVSISRTYLSKYIHIEKITIEDTVKQIIYFSREKIKSFSPQLLELLDQKNQGKDGDDYFKETFLNTYGLVCIIALLEEIDEVTELNDHLTKQIHCRVKKRLGSLRDIEEKIRNKAAHEMIINSEVTFNHIIGKESGDVIKYIEELMRNVIPDHFDKDLFVYDEINKLILNELGIHTTDPSQNLITV